MAETNNPLTTLPPAPAVSMRTIPIAGLLVDFYGLDELRSAPSASVSLLWLHHPRLRERANMADIAARCVHAVAVAADAAEAAETAAGALPPRRRNRLVAVAFDQRNHGSRLVAATANDAWREGNATHAQDMFGTIAGTMADTQLLMDLVEAYVHAADAESAEAGSVEAGSADAGARPACPLPVTQHLVLGVSLGGHSGWQLLFADPRVTAGVLVIGCPDYMALVADRARLSKRPTYRAADGGAADAEVVDAAATAAFLGSYDFPPALVAACCKYDPKGIVFGTAAAAAAADNDDDALHRTLSQRIAGKRFLVCSGGADKLVPYRCSAPFLAVLQQAAAAWPDLALTVRDNVYDGIGHAFSPAMLTDAVDFVVETVLETEAPGHAGTAAKI